MTHVFIHAGVVQIDGTTIIFPGFSRSGKSSLVWSFLQAGAVYYSDEYAVFDASGFVHPFPLPVHLRLARGRRLVEPTSVGFHPLAPEVIVFARYRHNAVWEPRALRPSETMLQLVRQSIGIRRNPSIVLPVLRKVSSQARAYRGPRGETAEVLHWAQQTVKGCSY